MVVVGVGMMFDVTLDAVQKVDSEVPNVAFLPWVLMPEITVSRIFR